MSDPRSATGKKSVRPFAITLDVHAWDEPDHLREAHAVLSSHGMPATFFVPTGVLQDAGFRRALRAIDDGFCEIASHSHQHDLEEIAALSTDAGSLGFLSDSKHAFEDFFGRAPLSFRSPCWCRLSRRTLDALKALGYQVDSSSTPQRLGLLSSYPFDNPWLTSARRPTFLRPGLLEIPTSSFIVPFGSGSLAAFRKWGAVAFAAAFGAEAWLADHVVNLQLHIQDFVPRGKGLPMRPFSWRDLLPRTGHGVFVRHWLLDHHRGRMAARAQAVLKLLGCMRFEAMTLTSIHDRIVDRAG